MKIALPVREDYQIDKNFEDCELYQIFTTNDKNEPLFVETTDTYIGFDFNTKMAEELEKEGIKILLAGNISTSAINILAAHGIKVIRNCEGYAIELVKLFLADKLKDGE